MNLSGEKERGIWKDEPNRTWQKGTDGSSETWNLCRKASYSTRENERYNKFGDCEMKFRNERNIIDTRSFVKSRGIDGKIGNLLILRIFRRCTMHYLISLVSFPSRRGETSRDKKFRTIFTVEILVSLEICCRKRDKEKFDTHVTRLCSLSILHAS